MEGYFDALTEYPIDIRVCRGRALFASERNWIFRKIRMCVKRNIDEMKYGIDRGGGLCNLSLYEFAIDRIILNFTM